MNLPFPGSPSGGRLSLDAGRALVLRYRHIAVGLLALTALGVRMSMAASPLPSLSLAQAIEAALQGNPSLQDFTLRVRAQDARAQQAALSPPTEAALTLENFGGTGDYRRLESVEATLALSHVVELGGKRAARVAAANAARDLLTIEREAEQVDVLAEVTRRFITVAIRQEQLKLAQTATVLAEKTVHNSDVRVRAARSPHVEIDRARVALGRAALDQQRAVSELEAARRQLSATWGESEATLHGRPFSAVSADLFQLPPIGSFDSLSSQLTSNPEFTQFASTTRLRDAELRLSATLRKPDIQWSVGVRRFQATRDHALVASVSVPLFAPRRAAPFVAESEALRDLVGVDRRAAEIRARAMLFELFQALSQAVVEAKSLHEDALPRIAEALKETEYAYRRGRYGYLELVDAQREYLSVQAAMIAASGDAHLLRADIERLTNGPLTPIPADAEVAQ